MKHLSFSWLRTGCLVMAFGAGLNLSVAHASETAGALFGHKSVDTANVLDAVGSPFTRALAAEYRALASYETNEMADYSSGGIFAEKSLASGRGDVVPPASLEQWSLSEADKAPLGLAHARLTRALNLGARERMPVETARAQAAFDCWIEQAEEGRQLHHIANCKTKFDEMMAIVDQAILNPTPAPVNAVINPAEKADYMVFFDTGKAKLSNAGQVSLVAIAEKVKAGDVRRIRLEGFTDTVGSRAANQRLSEKRVNAVKDGLVLLGVPEGLISIQAFGEEKSPVSTADSVREAGNRRVNIHLN